MDDTLSDVHDEFDSGDFESSPPPESKAATPPRPRFGGRRRRPGEQDPLQSPLVMWLFGGAVVLVIAAAVLWTVVQRYQRTQAYEAAKTEFEADRHRQAVTLYEAFLEEHPTGDLATVARRELARARVRKEIDTAVPDWEAGLARLEALIDEFREDEEFETFGTVVFEDARTIAFGAADGAKRAEQATLLAVHDAAGPIAIRYAPTNESDALRARLAKSRSEAERAVRRRVTYDSKTASIDESLESGQPLDALDVRFDLLDEFADYADDVALAERFDAALADLESAVEVALGGRPPAANVPAPPVGVTIVHEERNRRDRDSAASTEVVLAYAGGSVFGLDASTGSPLWRRPLGTDRAFFPVETTGVTAGVLAFNGHANALERLDLVTGERLWSQPCDGWPAGPPTERSGVVYLATSSGELLQIEASTGRVLGLAACGQPLVSTPVLLPGGRVVVVGERSVAYVFETAPLAVADVVFLGHRRGAAAGLTASGPQLQLVGPYVLFLENVGVETARLRLLSDDLEGSPPRPVATATVPGNVHDDVAIRGRRLFVPFGNEQVATFTLSAEPGQDPLVPAARLDRKGADVPVSILPGPADELWMASSSVRRFRVLIEAVQQAPGRTAEGRHVQPLRGIGERLFVGYQPPGVSETVVLELDRRTFDVGWRVSLAERFAATRSADGSGILLASESGRVYSVNQSTFDTPGFRGTSDFQVEFDEKTSSRGLHVVSDGFLFVRRHVDDELWTATVFSHDSNPKTTTVRLPSRPLLPPVPLEDGLLVATPGRLSLVSPTGTQVEHDARAGAATGWRTLRKLTNGDVVAQDDAGGLVRLAYRTQPVAHFGVTARIDDLDTPVAAAVGDAVVAVVDRRNHVIVFSTDRFERLGAFPLAAAPVRPPTALGRLVVVETKDGKLHGFTVGPAADPPWSIPLSGTTLSGPPVVVGDRLLATTRAGGLLWIDPRQGRVLEHRDLGVNFAGSPVVFGDHVVVLTTDGTVLRLPGPVDGGQP